MKVGPRTPSPTKSIKARTTGRIERTVKNSYNPVYGVKGVDYLTDPERAVKNKIYHKVTADPLDPLKNPRENGPDLERTALPQNKPYALIGFLAVVCLVCFIYALCKLAFSRELHLVPLVITVVSFILLIIVDRKNK